MEDVAEAYGVSLNLAQRWRAEGGRHRPHPGWEGILADLAERGAAANRDRAAAAEQLANELRRAAVETSRAK